MADRPILFSAPMVRALLSGSKTQTRRVVKPQPDGVKNFGKLVPYRQSPPPREMPSATYEVPIRCPYGVPGDTLWVKETLRRAPHAWTYGADGAEVPWPGRSAIAGLKKEVIVSIHCRRDCSRINLRITDVRVERLNAISEADALAEGITQLEPASNNGLRHFGIADTGPNTSPIYQPTASRGYRYLWDQINGEGVWAENPWVWAVSFSRETPPTASDKVPGKPQDPGLEGPNP